MMAQVNGVSELNKLKVRLFVEAVLNEGRLDLIDELVAADFLGHVPGAGPVVIGPEGVRAAGGRATAAPDPGLYIKIEDQIAEDDRVATCWQATVSGAERIDAADRRTAVLRGDLDHPVPGRKTGRLAHRMHRVLSNTIRGSARDMKTRSLGIDLYEHKSGDPIVAA